VPEGAELQGERPVDLNGHLRAKHLLGNTPHDEVANDPRGDEKSIQFVLKRSKWRGDNLKTLKSKRTSRREFEETVLHEER